MQNEIYQVRQEGGKNLLEENTIKIEPSFVFLGNK